MKHKAPLVSTAALTFALGLGVFVMAGTTSAMAGGSGYTPPAEEDCGCEPPPPPPPSPEEDCGCDDTGGHGGIKVKNWNWNQNSNSNTNSNTNTNTNTNDNSNSNNVVVNVNVDSSSNSTATASATAAANAVANADLANSVANNSSSSAGGSSASRSGGSGFGIGNGNGSGGGGGSYYVAAPQAMSMGVLNVVVQDRIVSKKPVKGVCVSAKGLAETALYSTSLRDLSPRDEAEVFHCLSGDMLVVTIGRMVGTGDQAVANYDGGYVIECHEGEALRIGANGLACAPTQSRWSKADARSEGRQGYAEVFIRKTARGEATASATGAGMATFSGGVGY